MFKVRHWQSQNIVTLSVFLIVFYLFSCNTASALTFKTSGSKLIDPCGEEMVIRGVNAGIAFPNNNAVKNLDEIARTGSNTVRLTYRWLINRSNPFSIEKSIKRVISNNMVAMPALWDATGDWSNFRFTVEFWAQPEMVSVLRKYEDMILLNIANEAGDVHITNDEYRTEYTWAIKKLRSAGLHMPLVIDAANWGRAEKYILDNASFLQQSDPDHNLIFSWHPWDSNQPRSRYDYAIKRALKSDIPMIIGEFANKDVTFSSDIDFQFLMALSEKRNIGWLWWWWYAGKKPDGHALTSDGQYGNWINRGEEVVLTSPYGLNETAKKTYYLNKRSCEKEMNKANLPFPPTDIQAKVIDGTEIEASWEDNSDDEKNFDIEVWNDRKKRWDLLKVVDPNVTSTRIGGAMSFPYNINTKRDLSFKNNKAYQLRVAAYISSDSKSYSDPIYVTTHQNVSKCSDGNGLKGEYYYAEHISLNFEKYAGPNLVRNDKAVDFNWGSSSPSKTIPSDQFQVRWTGYVEPQFSSEYTFFTNSDDFARVWVDNQLIINNWKAMARGWAVGKISLVAGKKYPIRVEYREWDRNAFISLYWAGNQFYRELVPECRLFNNIN